MTALGLEDRAEQHDAWRDELSKERGVWPSPPTPRSGALPLAERRICREALSGRNAARTGLRVMTSGRNARSKGTACTREMSEGLRSQPPRPGALRGWGV
jgi:hypothetical protein